MIGCDFDALLQTRFPPDSSSDDDSVFGDDQSRRQNRHRHGTPDSRSGNTPPSASSRQHNVYANVDIPGQSARTALADVMNQSRESRPSCKFNSGHCPVTIGVTFQGSKSI